MITPREIKKDIIDIKKYILPMSKGCLLGVLEDDGVGYWTYDQNSPVKEMFKTLEEWQKRGKADGYDSFLVLTTTDQKWNWIDGCLIEQDRRMPCA